MITTIHKIELDPQETKVLLETGELESRVELMDETNRDLREGDILRIVLDREGLELPMSNGAREWLRDLLENHCPITTRAGVGEAYRDAVLESLLPKGEDS